MTQLTSIILRFNTISVIENGSLSSLPKLKSLYLDNNRLGQGSIDLLALNYLPSMTHLTLFKNKMYHKMFPSFFFKQMPNLRWLEVDAFVNFRFADYQAYLPSVDHLVMYNHPCCYSLRNHTFSIESSAQIKILDVYLSDIQYGALCNLLGIELIAISIVLNADIMDGIIKSLRCYVNRNLTSLAIRNNDIAFILSKKLLRPLSEICVKRIELTSDSITRIDVQSFRNFAIRAQCLEELDLSFNPIATNSFVWFYCLSYLENLRIARFSHMRSKTKFAYCNLAKCKTSYGVHFNLPSQMQELYVRHGHPGWHISSVYFSGATKLRILDFSYETFCSCDLTVNVLPNLRYLDTSGWIFLSMRRNFLGSFPRLESFTSENSFLCNGFQNHSIIKHFLQNSTNLRHINLHGNNLNFLPSVFFDPVVMSLKFLNISNNNFSYIPLEVHKFKHLEILDLRNNMIKTIDSKQRVIE